MSIKEFKEQMQELVMKFATENQVALTISVEVTKTVFPSYLHEAEVAETYRVEDFQMQIR